MKERQEDLRGLLREHRRIMIGLFVCILLGAAAVVMICLTKDEAKHISSGEIQSAASSEATGEVVSKLLLTENIGCRAMAANPLTEASDEGLKRAVVEYYHSLAEHADFVESYENLRIYTKLGMYKGTYITFVRYDMKIRDIYTGNAVSGGG